MPTYAQTRPSHRGVFPGGYSVSPGNLTMGGNATGSNYALGEVGISALYGHPYLTRVVDPGFQEMLDEARLLHELAIEIPVEMLEGTGKSVFTTYWNEVTPDSTKLIWSYSHDLDSGMRTPEPSGQRVTVAAPSHAIGTQLDETATRISPKLQERLSQFESGRPSQETIREPVMAEVTSFIVRLCAESDAVSATFASDGTLSVAVDFPGETRLYAEIERDGSAEAVVIKERRYASDILEDAVAALTSEVILAAVNSA